MSPVMKFSSWNGWNSKLLSQHQKLGTRNNGRDDLMEVVRKGSEQELTEHLNSVDITCSIKFTYEEDSENSLPFLDTRMVRIVNEIV